MRRDDGTATMREVVIRRMHRSMLQRARQAREEDITMSSPQVHRDAQPSTVRCIQERASLSSSQEHQCISMHRNDKRARQALKEEVSGQCTDVRNAGLPGPGGRRNSKSNQANEAWST